MGEEGFGRDIREGAENPILVYVEKTGDWTDGFWFNKLQTSSLLSSLPWVWVQIAWVQISLHHLLWLDPGKLT